jgi:hypothetical protein
MFHSISLFLSLLLFWLLLSGFFSRTCRCTWAR